MIASEPLPHFVDDLLGYLHETHPTHATLDGVHTHDDLLEDVSRNGDRKRGPRALRLSAAAGRNQPRSADPRRAPRAPDADLASAGPDVRARGRAHLGTQPAVLLGSPRVEPRGAGAVLPRAGARTRAPRAVEAAPDAAPHPGRARQHQGPARHLRQGRRRDDARRAEVHRRGSAARVCRASTTCTCSATSPTRRPRRRTPSASYVQYLETEMAPKARASFRLGRDKFEQKLRLEEGITIPVDRLLAIATRELQETQEAFRSLAGRTNGGDPLAAWARVEGRASGPGRAGPRRPRAARGARDVPRAAGDHHAAGGRGGHRRSDARLLSLVVREHVDARPVRVESRRAPTTTSPTSIRRGRPSVRTSTCATTTSRRCGRSRFTRCIRGTSCTTSICAASNRRRASRSCSRPRRSSKGGRTTASR